MIILFPLCLFSTSANYDEKVHLRPIGGEASALQPTWTRIRSSICSEQKQEIKHFFFLRKEKIFNLFMSKGDTFCKIISVGVPSHPNPSSSAWTEATSEEISPIKSGYYISTTCENWDAASLYFQLLAENRINSVAQTWYSRKREANSFWEGKRKAT